MYTLQQTDKRKSLGGKDAPGMTEPDEGSQVLYTPEHKQYCISSVAVDKDGTIYFKNDSAYMIAVGNSAIDTDKLQDLIETAKATDASKYTDESYNALQDVIAEAEAVAENPESKEQVAEMTENFSQQQMDWLLKQAGRPSTVRNITTKKMVHRQLTGIKQMETTTGLELTEF